MLWFFVFAVAVLGFAAMQDEERDHGPLFRLLSFMVLAGGLAVFGSLAYFFLQPDVDLTGFSAIPILVALVSAWGLLRWFGVDLNAEKMRKGLRTLRSVALWLLAAFAFLAEKLDAMAAERVRPWWRRLVG